MTTTLAAAQALHRAGDLAGAERAYRAGLVARPGDAETAQQLAVLLLQTGRPGQALPLLQRLAAARPGLFDGWFLLAVACRQTGALAAGIEAAGRASALRPADPAAQALLGSLKVMAGAYAEGAALLSRALAVEPDHPDAAHYLAIAHHRRQRWDEALAAYRDAARLTPDDPRLHYNIGLCAEARGDLDAALDSMARAHALRPRRADALARLACLQAMTCRFDDEAASVAALERLLAEGGSAEPDDRVEPFALTFLPLSDAAASEVLRRARSAIEREVAGLGGPLPPPGKSRQGPLRIGYLSAEFGDHAVGGLMRDVFAAHDRTVCSVHAYSLRDYADPVAARIRAGCDAFHDCADWPTRAIAERIRADAIDVLFDLSGFTLGARPTVLALRPAPVQIGYLGFLHAYGGDLVDYLALDAEIAPPGGRIGPEAVIRLPTCLLPVHALPPVPAVDRARWGLPAGRALLASFNNSYKLDRALLRCWVEILRRCPRADLAIYLPGEARDGFHAGWVTAGGDPARLHWLDKLGYADHLSRAAACDLALDPLRYHGGATSVAALAAGLPVLCCAGDRPLRRMGVSLNRLLGAEDLVASDPADYVERAVRLVDRPARLAELRLHLASPAVRARVADPGRIARALEAAAAAAWARWEAGLAPTDLDCG